MSAFPSFYKRSRLFKASSYSSLRNRLFSRGHTAESLTSLEPTGKSDGSDNLKPSHTSNKRQHLELYPTNHSQVSAASEDKLPLSENAATGSILRTMSYDVDNQSTAARL